MIIAILAANGRTGKVFTELALKRGHTVRAGVHQSNPFKTQTGLTVIPTDATSLSEIKNLLQGCDAVASFIGHGKDSPPSVQTEATQAVVSAMTDLGIPRVISLTGTGVRLPGDKPSFIDKILNVAIARIDPNRINDGIMHAELLQDSPLDYTILRVLKLTNGRPQNYSLTAGGPARLFTSRQTVARAALDILEQDIYRKQAPVIS
jgi:nucleoside-diphosphate-sugar epimerase